jgi:hypothetical protein
MSRIRFRGSILSGASYLIRVDVDLGARLKIRDMDVHVLVRVQNQSHEELTSGEALAGGGDLEIECYDDGFATHRFGAIRFEGRVAVRTPQMKFALLKFRYPVAVENGLVHVGWYDREAGARIASLYPNAHAGPAGMYPFVHLEPGAAVHQINVAGPSRERTDADRETVAEDPRRLLEFIEEDHPDPAGNAVKVVKLGLHSYRTNSCRWLDLLVYQDAYWRGDVADEVQPIRLSLINPDGTQIDSPGGAAPRTLDLHAMANGRLLYAEAAGELASVAPLLTVDGRAEDGWELHDATTNPNTTLGTLALADLRRLAPLSARELAAAGVLPGAAAGAPRPVEMAVLQFAQPNPADAPLHELRT